MLGADGQTRWLSVTARPLFGARGTREAVLYNLIDVTQRHRHEAELRIRLDSEQALARFAELLILEDDPDRILSSAVGLIADLFDAPLVTAVRVARDRSEVESLAIAGGLGDCSPERWKGRHALTRGSATWAAVDAGEAVRVGDFSCERLYRPGPIARSAAARSVACVPIAGGAGCLAVCHTEAERRLRPGARAARGGGAAAHQTLAREPAPRRPTLRNRR